MTFSRTQASIASLSFFVYLLLSPSRSLALSLFLSKILFFCGFIWRADLHQMGAKKFLLPFSSAASPSPPLQRRHFWYPPPPPAAAAVEKS
jgi:hypothetical protein